MPSADCVSPFLCGKSDAEQQLFNAELLEAKQQCCVAQVQPYQRVLSPHEGHSELHNDEKYDWFFPNFHRNDGNIANSKNVISADLENVG